MNYCKIVQKNKYCLPSKTTLNGLFYDIWCYLFIAGFEWKIGVFQQTVVRVYYILTSSNLALLFSKSILKSRINIMLLCVCVCLYSSTCWFLPAARRLWHAWEGRINDLLLWVWFGRFCQVPSSQFLNLSYFTSKDENSSPLLLERKRMIYNALTKRWYTDIGYRTAIAKPSSNEKILKIRRLL